MTFDQFGNPIRGARFRPRPAKVRGARGMGGMGTATDAQPIDQTLGGALFRFFNPGTVQQEFANVTPAGQTPPSIFDIMTGAATDASAAAVDQVTSGVTGLQSTAQWLIIGVVALAIIEVMSKIPKGRQ